MGWMVSRELKKGKRSHVCQCVGLARWCQHVLVFCVYQTDNSHILLFGNFHFNTFIFLYATFSLLHSVISFFDQLMSNVLFNFFFSWKWLPQFGRTFISLKDPHKKVPLCGTCDHIGPLGSLRSTNPHQFIHQLRVQLPSL